MILDKENIFSDGQDLAGISGATASTDYIDMTATERQIGTGEPVRVRANLPTALVGSGATLTITIQVDDNSSFSSAATVLTLPVIAAASAAGTAVEGILPSGAVATERYMQALITPGAAVTSGSVDIFLASQTDGYRKFASGFSISQ